MSKKKKGFIIFTVVFLAALVFVIFYFKDNTDLTVVEKKQDKSINSSVDSMFNEFNNMEFDFEEDTTMVESDSVESI